MTIWSSLAADQCGVTFGPAIGRVFPLLARDIASKSNRIDAGPPPRISKSSAEKSSTASILPIQTGCTVRVASVAPPPSPLSRRGSGHLRPRPPRAHSASTGEDWPVGSAAGTFSVNGRGLAWRKRRWHIQRQRAGSAAGTFSVNGRGLAWRKRRWHIQRQRARTGL